MRTENTLRRSTRRVLACLAITLLLAGVTACSDDDEGGGGGGGGDSSAAASAAKERVDPLLESSTSIGIEEPLAAAPESGRKVYWLEGNIQSIAPITQGFEEATEAAGWDLETVTYDPADPQGPASAMQQAVQGGADYIAVSGQTVEALGEALDDAKSAGIPVIDLYSTDEVGGDANGIYANVGSADYSRASYPRISDLVISDSGGDAKVLFVNIPDFPILQIASEAAVGQFEDECPDCEVTELDVSIQDLTSGGVASQVVSSLQSDPSIEYVYVSIGDLASGLPDAIDGAGLGDKVKVVGHVPNPEQLQAVADGKSFAYIPLPRPFSAWQAVDAMLRLDQEMTVDPAVHGLLPIEIWTTENVPEPVEEYEGPDGYQDAFTELWGV